MAQDFSIPKTLQRTAGLLNRDKALIGPAWLIWLGAATALNVLTPSDFFIAPNILSLLVGAFFSAMLTYAAVGTYTPSLNEAASVGGRAYGPVLLVSIVSFIATMVGLVLLLLPELAAAIFLSLVVPVMMAERPPIIDTFRRSIALIMPVFFPVLGFAVIIFAPSLIAIAIASAVIEGLFGMAVSSGAQEASAGVISIYASAAAYLTLTGGHGATIIDAFD